MKRSLAFYLSLALCSSLGCNDPQLSPIDVESIDAGAQVILDGGVGASRMDSTTNGFITDAMSPEQLSDSEVPGSNSELARIEVNLTPRSVVYAPGQTVAASANAYNRFGDAIEDFSIEWRVSPTGMAEITPTGVLSFNNEGQGVLWGCVGEVCGRTVFLVDGGPPSLRIDEPSTEARTGGGRDAFIAVSGVATDSFGRVSVRVNGRVVDVSADGAFATRLPARLGMNHIEIEAHDGVNTQSSVQMRDVLIASDYRSTEPDVSRVDGAVSLELGQAVFFDRASDEPGLDGPAMLFNDLSRLLETLLQMVDLSVISPSWRAQVAEAQTIEFQLADMDDVTVDASIENEGIEFYLHFSGLSLRSVGQLVVDGEPLSLNGHLNFDLYSVVTTRVRLDGGVSFEISHLDTFVDGMAPRYVSPLAASLFAERGELGHAVGLQVTGNVESLLEDRLPMLLDSALAVWSGDASSNRSVIEVEDGGLVESALLPSMTVFSPGYGMTVQFDGTIINPDDVEGELGAPIFPETESGFGADGALVFSVSVNLLNALLHQAWLRGAFTRSSPNGIRTGTSLQLNWGLPPVVAPSWRPGASDLLLQFGDGRLIELDETGAQTGRWSVGLDSEVEAAFEGGAIRAVLANLRWFVEIPGGDADTENLAVRLQETLRGDIWPGTENMVQRLLRVGFGAIAVDTSDLAAGAAEVRDIRMESIMEGTGRLVGHRLHWVGRTQSVIDRVQLDD